MAQILVPLSERAKRGAVAAAKLEESLRQMIDAYVACLENRHDRPDIEFKDRYETAKRRLAGDYSD